MGIVSSHGHRHTAGRGSYILDVGSDDVNMDRACAKSGNGARGSN